MLCPLGLLPQSQQERVLLSSGTHPLTVGDIWRHILPVRCPFLVHRIAPRVSSIPPLPRASVSLSINGVNNSHSLRYLGFNKLTHSHVPSVSRERNPTLATNSKEGEEQRERECRTSVYAAGNGTKEGLERKSQRKGLEDGCATEGL